MHWGIRESLRYWRQAEPIKSTTAKLVPSIILWISLTRMTEVCVQARGTCAEIWKTKNKSSEKYFSDSSNLSNRSWCSSKYKNYYAQMLLLRIYYINFDVIIYQCFGSDKLSEILSLTSIGIYGTYYVHKWEKELPLFPVWLYKHSVFVYNKRHSYQHFPLKLVREISELPCQYWIGTDCWSQRHQRLTRCYILRSGNRNLPLLFQPAKIFARFYQNVFERIYNILSLYKNII